jgi:hypothetical protein
MTDLGKLLLVLGGVIFLVGAVLLLAGKFNLLLGRLPDDIVYRGKNSVFYFPIDLLAVWAGTAVVWLSVLSSAQGRFSLY